MPPQDKTSASDYGNQDIVKILASPEFQSAPPELQRQVRERLGIVSPAASTSVIRQREPGDFIQPRSPIRRGLNWILGAAGPDPQYKHKTLLEDLERTARATAERRFLEDTRDPTRTHAGAAFRQFSPRAVADLAHLLHGQGTAKNAAITGLSFIPMARPIIGAIGVVSGGKEALKPRQPEESEADYIQRVLLGASQVAGSAALGKSGRLRTAKSEMEQRIARASYASGSAPGVPNAYRMTIPDIMETVTLRKMPLKTVSDIARAVEATNERFNAQMALAEQPYSNELVLPQKAADALRAAADELPGSAANEAAQMRNAARQFDRPMTLRELGREMRQQNKLWGTHGGKTSLELSTAKTRASVAINDILRKSLRDTYVEFLESKHPGSGLRDMRLRQEQILNLRDTLGEYNRATGRVEKGHAEKLEAAQAKFKGGPTGEDIHGVASQHGIRAYLRIPKGMRAGPETLANRRVKSAFKEDIGHRIPRRKLGPLTPAKRPPEAEPEIESLRRGSPGEPPPTTTEQDVTTAARVKDRVAEAKARTESFKRQMSVAEKKHPDWAERIRAAEAKADAAAKAGGDPEAARLKELATPKSDEGHLAKAVNELYPGKTFDKLTPAEQSQAVQRSLELKFGSTKKPPAKTGD